MRCLKTEYARIEWHIKLYAMGSDWAKQRAPITLQCHIIDIHND